MRSLPQIADIVSSFVLLPERSGLARLPRAPRRRRPESFDAAFDGRSLYYDVFWHADGMRVLLIGPPPVNLKRHYRTARFTALPSGTPLKARLFPSLSVMTTELADVPMGTQAIGIAFGPHELQAPVRRNLAELFRGRRLLFGMNRDNDLDWITFWARWHARRHGTDALVLFDNGSTRYAREEIAAALSSIPGLGVVAVPAWPGPFGQTDPAVRTNPYWAHFRQIASMGVVLRRFAPAAAGILNCDIDELASAPEGENVYALARKSSHGLLSMKGEWIEAVPEPGLRPRDHGDFPFRLREPKARHCDAGKWVLDPSRSWLSSLRVHPYWHWIEHRPLLAKRYVEGAHFWHFRGISTNWKDSRTGAAVPGQDLERDERLAEAMAALRPSARLQTA